MNLTNPLCVILSYNTCIQGSIYCVKSKQNNKPSKGEYKKQRASSFIAGLGIVEN